MATKGKDLDSDSRLIPQTGETRSLDCTNYAASGEAVASSCTEGSATQESYLAASKDSDQRQLYPPSCGTAADGHSTTKKARDSTEVALWDQPALRKDNTAVPLWTPDKQPIQPAPAQLPLLRPLDTDMPTKPQIVLPGGGELYRGLFLQLPTPSNALPEVFPVDTPPTEPALPPSCNMERTSYVCRNLCKELFPDRLEK